MRCAHPAVLEAVALLIGVAAPAVAQPPGLPPLPGGAGVFQRGCAACHASPAADSRAPSQAVLATFMPDAIVNALTNGSMRIQGEKLTDTERVDVAEFLTGRSVGTPSTATLGQCASSPARFDPSAGPSWNGWGAGVANTRFQPAKRGGLTAVDVPKLKLKWAFGFAGVLAARAQPAVVGGRLFVASETGAV
jgi:polyvinyl alcohol dehydrogenase (cytochrome)